MLSFGCSGSATFEQRVQMTLSLDPGETALTLSIFDGDTGGVDGLGNNHWDTGNRQLVYRLYFDPSLTGNENPADLVGEWYGNDPNSIINPDPDPEKFWFASDVFMPNNNWWGVTINASSLAQAPSGNYFYHLVIQEDGACAPGEQLVSDIKLASTGPMNFLVPRFGFEASLRNPSNTGPIIYAPFDPLNILTSTTTYDGTFEVFLNISDEATDLVIFDGDFDHGTGNLTGVPSGVPLTSCADVDDPDTANDYTGFPFIPTGAANEGAVGGGAPADDSAGDLFRRGELGSPNRIGCVRYEVIDPNGVVYRNDNPSGNLEWEQFRIAAGFATDPANADYGPTVAADGSTFVTTDLLPAGVWTVRIIGLDMSNLNFWFFQERVCATLVDGGPGGPGGDALAGPVLALRQTQAGGAACAGSAFVIGDTVWFDTDGNGVQDAGEAGIPGVMVTLLDDTGTPVRTVMTGDTTMPEWENCVANNTGLDTAGLYCFGIDVPDTYTVRVAPENFDAGGALEGYASTTGGDEQTDTLIDDNVLTYDFGYEESASFVIGDTVWSDSNENGTQDAGEAGFAGVVVNLLDGSGNTVQSVTTGDTSMPNWSECVANNTGLDTDGLYCFVVDEAGTYTIEIAAENYQIGGVLDGYISTTGGDQQTNTVVDGNVLIYDFGYALEPTGGQGCTPGYWKQKHHFDSWVGYLPSDSYNAVFGVNYPGDPTLLDALRKGGGGYKALGRHSVAALLNAAASGVSYLYTQTQIINMVQAAYASGDYETTKDLFVAENEAGCPLN